MKISGWFEQRAAAFILEGRRAERRSPSGAKRDDAPATVRRI